MSRQGQYVYKGINSQAWAAMSLFLQYLREPNFSYIQLEAPQFEDFNLVFNDGHKIICESKAWKQRFNFSHLKKVLASILGKTAIQENDEILIICTNLDEDLKRQVANTKYWNKLLVPQFKQKGFSDQQINVLDRVRFWKIQEKDNHLVVYSLFGELLDFWLPEDELEAKADSIIIKRIYEGSAKGDIYHREEILSHIEQLRKKARKYSGYFDDERVKIEGQLENLIEAMENNKSPVWAEDQLKAISSKPALMFFVLDQFKEKRIDNLEDWKKLWQLHKIYRFSFSLFRIFEHNLHTKENKRYVLQFIKDNIGEVHRFYQHDFFDMGVVKIADKIIADGKRFLAEVFEIVRKLIAGRRDDIFYLGTQRNRSWEKREVAKLLRNTYKQASPNLKDKIYEFIVETFNLIKDEGNFSHYTPREVFGILKDYLIDNLSGLEENFLALSRLLANQYQEFYKKLSKRLTFEGWEHMGGTTSSWGHSYTVSDRHFIIHTLEPALWEYYQKNKRRTWRFILSTCISKTEGVKRDRPDFLNRAVIPITLDRYNSRDKRVSQEAFEVLKEFILSRKGIPHKSDLIYQEIKDKSPLSDDRRWKLVEVSTRKYGIPVSVFVEEIVSQLAKKGHREAKKELKRWLRSPKYYERFGSEINVAQNIRAVLDSDFDFAVGMFDDFTRSKQFIRDYDSFETYEIAALLYDILRRNPERGLKIIHDLSREKGLTKNQQILLCFGLFNYRGNDKSDSIELLEKVYHDFVDPFLNNLGDRIHSLYRKIPHSNAREALVQFANRLAYNKKIKEALRIVEVFINDPNPYLPGKNLEDPKAEYNEHKKIEDGEEPRTITSVRGWCAWVLMKCSSLSGRDYIPEIIDLTEQLAKDKNYYVKHMVCFPVAQLAQNRLTVLPENRNVLFFSDDKREALRMAKAVERTAFNLLRAIAQSPQNVQKALAKSVLAVFNHIRTLNEKDAIRLISTLARFPDEAVAESAPLFIYYAEFRKNAFRKWKWAMPGLYDDLSPDKFDDRKFKKILLEVMDKLAPDKRSSFAAEFEHLVRSLDYAAKDAEKIFEIAYKYLDYLAKDYDHRVFNVIYASVKEGMEKKHHFDKWHKLLIKCLRKEREFYDENFDKDKTTEMYWWPSYHNEDILMLVYNQGGKKKFLDAFDVITSFPKELEIHDTDKVVSLLQNFPKTSKKVKVIVNRLFQKNPSRYYKLKKRWLK